ncbi:MAG: ABC-type bacteriocin/lantibiotic exporter with N-terminal double-glycine peptidase domain [Schumannella sp.]|nr:ABC-type bacteriocin/lantibiotic exporter with N-terminal double-glycine peptidase domain [Schumannella sp.]
MKGLIPLFREVLSVLPREASRFLIIYMIALAALSFLDAGALALLAAATTPVLTGTTLTLPLIGEVSQTGLLVMLGLVCLLVVAKSVLAITLLWGATRRFANYELTIGGRLFESYIHAPWVERLKRNSVELVRMSDSSVAVTISGFLLPGSTLLGEFMTFVSILVVLAIAQPLLAAVAFVYLMLIGLVLFFWVTRKSKQAGQINQKYSVRNVRLIAEMVGALKEVTLRDKADEIAAVVRENRRHTSRSRANMQFLGQVPRYVLESGIIGGVVLVGITGFLQGGGVDGGGIPAAMSAVAIFGLAGFRMAPSIVRFQSIVSQVTSNEPHAEAVVREIRAVEKASEHLAGRAVTPLAEHPVEMRFEKVAFRYAPDSPDAVRDLEFTIPFGSSVAFVGSSGAGKSTIVDLVLGLIEPTRGRITIDGVDLHDLTQSWRARVGYVPQDVALFDSTIAQNVALSWTDNVDRDLVRASLKQAQLLGIVDERPGGIDGMVGERGLALSGGQKQRLGIARAIYAKPLVLVMDEATSALDTATEAAVSKAIRTLQGKVTLITVAHRLSTIRHADRIFFMSEGRVAASGTFDELVASVPEFALQAALAGLAPVGATAASPAARAKAAPRARTQKRGTSGA